MKVAAAGEGHGESLAKTRDDVREEMMEDVLAAYFDKPEAHEEHKEIRFPCWKLRRALGLAHVTLHDAVLDGKQGTVTSTLARLKRWRPDRMNDYDDEGRTALSLAVKAMREDIAFLIIYCNGVDVNKPDSATGLSPLHHCAQLNLPTTAHKLVTWGADVNARDKVMMTPLMLAARLGHTIMVELLGGQLRADVDAQDRAGWTALHYAVSCDRGGAVEALLALDADATIADAKGKLPADWAQYLDFGELCDELERAQKRPLASNMGPGTLML